MTETRDFPTPVVASMTTGILLCDFSAVSEAAEFLMGHPIWTHQYPSLRKDMERAILEQCPGMPTDLPNVDSTNWQEAAAKLIAEFGPTVKIRKGSGLTAMLPTDGIPDHLKDKTIIVAP